MVDARMVGVSGRSVRGSSEACGHAGGRRSILKRPEEQMGRRFIGMEFDWMGMPMHGPGNRFAELTLNLKMRGSNWMDAGQLQAVPSRLKPDAVAALGPAPRLYLTPV